MKGLPLQGFLEALRAEGLTVGVDDHVCAQRLLAAELGGDPEALRLALRAALARSVDDGARFDAVWDRWFVARAPSGGAPSSLRGASRVPSAWSLRVWVGILALGMGLHLAIRPWVATPEVGNGWSIDEGQYQQPAPRETMDDLVAGWPAPSLEPVGGEEAREPEGPVDVQVSPVQVLWGLGSAGFGVLALWLFATAWTDRRQRRGRQDSPFTFALELKSASEGTPLRVQQAEDLADALHYIEATGVSRGLDVVRTVRATAARGGVPTLRFRRPGVAPSYAVALDHTAPSLPVTLEMIRILSQLRRAGVKLHLFRYEGAPTALVPLAGGPTTDLVRLSAEVHTVLIVVGDPGAALAASDGRGGSGDLMRWVDDLARFPRRVWLSTVPETWHAHAIARLGAQGTPVHPAALESLRLASPREDERAQRSPVPPWPRVIDEAPSSPAALMALDRWLGDGFELLCAVARLPEPDREALGWVLDRFAPTLDAEVRLRLFRVPWLASGRWPEGVRSALQDALALRDPELWSAVGAALDDVLRGQEPPPGSGAHARWRVHRLEQAALDGRADEASAHAAALARGPALGRHLLLRSHEIRRALPSSPSLERSYRLASRDGGWWWRRGVASVLAAFVATGLWWRADRVETAVDGAVADLSDEERVRRALFGGDWWSSPGGRAFRMCLALSAPWVLEQAGDGFRIDPPKDPVLPKEYVAPFSLRVRVERGRLVEGVWVGEGVRPGVVARMNEHCAGVALQGAPVGDEVIDGDYSVGVPKRKVSAEVLKMSGQEWVAASHDQYAEARAMVCQGPPEVPGCDGCDRDEAWLRTREAADEAFEQAMADLLRNHDLYMRYQGEGVRDFGVVGDPVVPVVFEADESRGQLPRPSLENPFYARMVGYIQRGSGRPLNVVRGPLLSCNCEENDCSAWRAWMKRRFGFEEVKDPDEAKPSPASEEDRRPVASRDEAPEQGGRDVWNEVQGSVRRYLGQIDYCLEMARKCACQPPTI